MNPREGLKLCRDIVTLAGGVAVIIASSVYLFEKSKSTTSTLETYCNISLIQGGKCRFTNASTGSGRECTEVSLTNKSTQETDKTTVCSGYVGPYETKNVDYSLDASRICKQDFDNCDFNVQ